MLVHDMSKEQRSTKMRDVSRHAFVEEHDTAPYHQNSNLAERRGGDIKAAILKAVQMEDADLTYWCYALQHITIIRQHLARKKLGYLAPIAILYGETNDVSIFRIPLFHPVWYYCKTASFQIRRCCQEYSLALLPELEMDLPTMFSLKSRTSMAPSGSVC